MTHQSPFFSGSFVVRSMAETEALAARIAGGLRCGDFIALSGELGSGKTTLVRAILRALGVREPVPSPTFMLVQHYRTTRIQIAHYDLYRIADPREMEELAMEEALDSGAVLVEWPERAGRIPAAALRMCLEIESDGTRKIEFTGPKRWADHLAGGAHVGQI